MTVAKRPVVSSWFSVLVSGEGSCLLRLPLGGIGAGRRIYIHVQVFETIDTGRVATSIAVVVGRTRSSNISPLGRLRELPYFGEGNAACCGVGWTSGKNASRRGRAGIVRHPIHDFPSRRILTDILGRDHRRATFFFRSDSRTVDAGVEARSSDGVDPGINVSFLLGKHPAALFLVKKDDRSRGKTFAARGGHGSLCV